MEVSCLRVELFASETCCFHDSECLICSFPEETDTGCFTLVLGICACRTSICLTCAPFRVVGRCGCNVCLPMLGHSDSMQCENAFGGDQTAK